MHYLLLQVGLQAPDAETLDHDRRREGGRWTALLELPVIDIRSAITAAVFPGEPITRTYYPYNELFKPGKDASGVGTDDTKDEEDEQSESEE